MQHNVCIDNMMDKRHMYQQIGKISARNTERSEYINRQIQ